MESEKAPFVLADLLNVAERFFVSPLPSMTSVEKSLGLLATMVALTIRLFARLTEAFVESIQFSGDTDFEVTCFTAGFSVHTFNRSYILVESRCPAMTLPVQHWMNIAIRPMKNLLESSFSRTLFAAMQIMKKLKGA